MRQFKYFKTETKKEVNETGHCWYCAANINTWKDNPEHQDYIAFCLLGIFPNQCRIATTAGRDINVLTTSEHKSSIYNIEAILSNMEKYRRREAWWDWYDKRVGSRLKNEKENE